MSKLIASIFIIGVFTVKGQSITDINSKNVMQFFTESNKGKIIPDDVKSQSLVIQQGNFNETNLFLIDDKVTSIQSGDSNLTLYRDSNPALTSEMTISLQGHNNLVEVNGSNSISNGMSIEIMGNNKAVFVENK